MGNAAAKVVELGPHTKMTPEQALAFSAREDWESVVIVGFHTGSGQLVVRSSVLSREACLWIAEHLKMHVLDL